MRSAAKLGVALLVFASRGASQVSITHVNVIDVESGTVQADRTLVIEADRIRERPLGIVARRVTPADRAGLYARFVRNHTALVPTLIAGLGFRRMPDSLVIAMSDGTSAPTDPRHWYVDTLLAHHWRRPDGDEESGRAAIGLGGAVQARGGSARRAPTPRAS